MTALRQAIAERQEVNVILRNYRKDGTAFWNDLFISPVPDEWGQVTHFIGVQNDISAQRSAEQALSYNASHDVLTGTPNLSLLKDRLLQGFSIAERHGCLVALIMFNLDGFKGINSSLSLASGDRILVEVAHRLQSLVRPGDTVARLSADEFAVLLPDIMGEEEVIAVVEPALRELAKPFYLDRAPIYLTASAGIALSGEGMAEAEDLIRHASLAVRQAKGLGGDMYYWFTEEMNETVSRRVGLRNDIQVSLEREAFEVHYQPIIESRTGRVLGMEALVRWRHPVEGLLSPASFLSVAESTGQIVPLGDWVLRQACADTARLVSRGLDYRVAVNVSAVQFQRGDVVGSVRRALAETGLPAKHLELEIVESVLLEDEQKVREALAALRVMGVGIAIDDFGTGFSNMACLKQIPVTKLKIDLSFIRGVVTESADAAITRGIISLAQKLRLEVVGEGVEDEYQAAFLIRHQCDLLQGYYFSRPMPFAEFEVYKRSENSGHLFEANWEQGDEEPRTLLLLDDEDNILRSLKRLLRRDGYQILATTSADEALKLLSKHSVQVVLSDQRMPEMNGTEFFSRVKDLYPETVRIILSGYTDLDSVTDAVNRGSIYKFLTKPWDDELLRSEIQQAFVYYKATRQAQSES